MTSSMASSEILNRHDDVTILRRQWNQWKWKFKINPLYESERGGGGISVGRIQNATSTPTASTENSDSDFSFI